MTTKWAISVMYFFIQSFIKSYFTYFFISIIINLIHLGCDVWFDAKEVWEIKGADIQLSPVYSCGVDVLGGERGLGIRFPRLLRVRDDK